MNDQKDRDRLHQAIDRTLSGLNGDPFLSQRIAARAAQCGKGDNMQNHRNAKWIVMAALIAVMSLFTVAVAGELLSGVVDWEGNVIKDEHEIPEVLPTPQPTGQDVDRDRLLADFWEKYPAGELEWVECYDLTKPSSMGSSVYRNVTHMDDLAALTAGAEYMPLPVAIPEGYRILAGHVYYGCKPEGGFRLIETVDSEEGFRMERYALDEENAVVTGYDLHLAKESNDTTDVYIYAFLSNNLEEMELYIRESTGVSVVSIPGMTKAMFIQEAVYNQMNMYCDLPQPVDYRAGKMVYEGSQDQVYITITSDASLEETLALFGGK